VKAVAGGVTALLLLPLLFVAAITGAGGGDGWASSVPAASTVDVPAEMWALYAEAASRFGIQPAILAAVGKIECDHNRNPACGVANSAGAIGPMQFLPATFAGWSWASGNPSPSPLDPRDAVFAAAAKLAGDGAVSDPEGALFSYNHSRAYVATVEAWALAYGWTPPSAAVVERAVLAHPSLSLRPLAVADVRRGVVDQRVLTVLLVVTTRHELAAVGPFAGGHTYFVAGTDSPSNHAFGRAVDLPLVDGQAVSTGNGAARAAVEAVMTLPPALRPTEIGCPWLLSIEGATTFTKGHADHLHFGWDR
jgi:hypothetical protein